MDTDTAMADAPALRRMSAMAGLRASSWPSHQRLELRLDVKRRFSSVSSYRQYLEKMYGFCVGLERGLVRSGLQRLLDDLPERSKLPLLSRDLTALGLSAEAIAQLPACDSIPAYEEPAGGFGCLYVIEGATLGGRSLLPLIRSRLGLTLESGAAFFSSYGDAVDAMWSRFGTALDAWCETSERRQSAYRAAMATFAALESWLCGARA